MCKKTLALVLAICVLIGLSTSLSYAEIIELKLASQQSAEHPQTKTLDKFAELVKEKSGGTINVVHYPNNQLGPADIVNDMLIVGSIDMAAPGGIMAQSYPLTAVVECPYIFRDWDHVKTVFLNSDILEKLDSNMPKQVGVRSLGWVPVGFREVTTNKEINSFADFKGLRLRVPNVPYCIWFAEGIGASPITMNFSELFTALEQGMVDAQENPYNTIVASKVYEAQKYLVETSHMFTGNAVYINEKKWNSLSAAQQEIVQASMDQAIEFSFELALDNEKAAKKILTDAGLTIIALSEETMMELRDSQKETHKKFFEKYPGSEEYVNLIIGIE